MANREVGRDSAILNADGIAKNYGGIHALKGVDFSLSAGEVRGLVGENGAGKSTLIKILAGAEIPNAGTVTVNGEPLVLGNPQASLAAGISTVYQEPTLFGELNVVENIFLGREIADGGRVNWKAQYQKAVELLELLGLNPKLAGQTVADLPVGEQQLISIAKAFATDVKVLILDEPSAILSGKEISILFDMVARLKATGTGIIYISHRLDELAKITDSVTVMRDGEIVTTKPIVGLSTRTIAELMVGRELTRAHATSVAPGEVVLDVSHLAGGKALQDVSFQLRQREILGIYGLVGSGSGDIARAIYGIDPPSAGQVRVCGKEVQLSSPGAAKKAGFTMAPGNRRRDGVFLDKTLTFNMASSHFDYFSNKFGWMKARAENDVMESLMVKLRIKAPKPTTPIGALSGGNQQKVVIARQLVGNNIVTILEEPTQGVDVGAQAEIHKLIFDIAADDGACLVVSTDLEEVRTLCDRVIVMHQGKAFAEFPRGVAAAALLAAASGDSEGAEVEES